MNFKTLSQHTTRHAFKLYILQISNYFLSNLEGLMNEQQIYGALTIVTYIHQTGNGMVADLFHVVFSLFCTQHAILNFEREKANI